MWVPCPPSATPKALQAGIPTARSKIKLTLLAKLANL